MLDIKALLNKLVDHYNNVGKTYHKSGTYSSLSSSSSLTTIGSITQLPKGKYMCYGYVQYPGYSSGYRVAQIGYMTDGTTTTNKGSSRVSIPSPGATYGVWICTSCAVDATGSSNSIFLRACQNRGSAITDIEWHLVVVRIK